MIAPEASTRCENFATVENADHISICRPTTKTTRSFRKLKLFLEDIDENMKDEVKVFEEKRAKEEAKASHHCQGLPDHPVELETRAQEVMKKLRGGAVLGIFGMGGIGKTTLAKQVYNTISRDFEYTGFVDNVKGHDRHQLEDWLLTHFHKRGMKLDRIQWSDVEDTKILLVMDDITSEDQLKCLPKFQHFGRGSCLIMTSRDKEVFKVYKDLSVHEVDCLEEEDSEELFCQNAFGSKEIPNLLQKSVKSVVRKCGGLPLTLEVMGHYLRDHTNDAKAWKQTIDKLGKAQSITGSQDDRLWASLKVSYDCLCKEEQDMFIEAAKIFFQKPLDEALAGWSSITKNAETTWRNLVNRSLVKEIDDYSRSSSVWPPTNYKCKYVWVHEQLRDLAEKIMNGTMASGMNEGANLLVHQLNTNTVEVQPISLRLAYYSNQEILQLDKLAMMKRLKYMELERVVCEGRGKGLASHLCILKCEGQYLSRHGVILRGIGDKLPPAFDISLDKMKNLAVLDLRTFVVAKNFPEALGNLTNLQILVLVNLEGLDHLPENFGNLSLLKRLEVGCLRSLKLPKSLGNLKALEHLAFKCIGSLEFPESLEGLPSLVTLHIKESGEYLRLSEYCKHLDYPHYLDWSVSLFRLRGLQALPSSFGHLCALEELDLVALELKTLSDSFVHLTRLVKLGITSRELETLPENFYLLKSLRWLKIHCEKLGRLPERLGELALLEKLELLVDSVKALPESVANLSSLRFLKFRSENAKVVPESLGQLRSLKTLELDCASLARLPDGLYELSSVEEVSISAKRLQCLLLNIGPLQSLRRLTLNVSSVTSLPESIGQSFSLEELKFDCHGHKETSDLFENLSSFAHELVLIGENVEKLPKGLGRLTSLRALTLEFRFGESLPEELGELRSLERLRVGWCNSLKSLPESLGRISSLREVTLIQCEKLKSLPHSLGDNTKKRKKQEEESSQTKDTAGMQLRISHCKFLDDSLLESLGWTSISKAWWRTCYQRKRTQ